MGHIFKSMLCLGVNQKAAHCWICVKTRNNEESHSINILPIFDTFGQMDLEKLSMQKYQI